MAINAIQWSAPSLDLSGRFFENHTVVASPAAAAETIICSLTIPAGLFLSKGVFLEANAAFTVGTSGTNGNLRIRQTNVSGTVIYSTGGVTMAATNLVNLSAQGLDPSPPAAPQVYVVTLQVTAGAATSTVSAVSLIALAT